MQGKDKPRNPKAQCPFNWQKVQTMDDPQQKPAPETTQVAAHLARNLASLRHARGMTQQALAKHAAVPRSTITNLESGQGNPSLAVLVKIAAAMGVPIDELLATPRASIRQWAGADIASRNRGHGVTTRALVPEPVPDELMELMDFAPGGGMGGTPHLPGTREYFTCLSGSVILFVAGQRNVLASGDVLAFPGNVPHSYQNASGAEVASGVSVVVLAKAGV
jgi:XRE family transcriptional regulator, regulator of sulfur utilization